MQTTDKKPLLRISNLKQYFPLKKKENLVVNLLKNTANMQEINLLKVTCVWLLVLLKNIKINIICLSLI